MAVGVGVLVLCSSLERELRRGGSITGAAPRKGQPEEPRGGKPEALGKPPGGPQEAMREAPRRRHPRGLRVRDPGAEGSMNRRLPDID
eukprot:9469407-Pyramimonas_sp.AAC.1